MHAKVADALVSTPDPDWQSIATHYETADRFDDAADAYGRHRRCAAPRALAEAVAYLTEGLAARSCEIRSESRPTRDGAPPGPWTPHLGRRG